MKKLSHFIAIIGVFAVLANIKPAAAFLPFIGGGTPTIDGTTDGSMGVNFSATKIKTTIETTIQPLQETIQTLGSKYNEYKNDFIGVMNSEQKPPLGGTRTILDSIFGKKDDPEAIRRAVYDLFLTFPSDDFYEQQACKPKIQQFYIDTMIEINTAAIKLEQEYETSLKEKVENLSTDILTGENGAEVADSNNSAWKNKYNVYNTMNDLMQMLEELTAMKAQYLVARGVVVEIPTKEPDSTSEETTSSLDMDEPVKLAGYAEHKEVMAFGQVSQETTTGGYTFRYQPDANSNMSFKQVTEAGQDSPYAGSREALSDLTTIDPVYNKVVTAMKIHNLKQSLASRRKNADKYNDFLRLHEKAVESVKKSDTCVVKFLDQYYQDGEKSWNGVFIGNQVTEYDLREGISGWALASYEAAKELLSANDEESTSNLAEVELDPTVDSTNLNSVATVKSNADSQNTEGGFKEKSKEEQAKENEREAELLAWTVGAEAIAQIAQDQYSENPQWGTVKKKFPIWEDQKSFYGQYLIGKYGNMKSYLARVDLRRRAGQLALAINEEITDGKVAAAEAKAKAATTEEEKKSAEEEVKRATEIGSIVNSAIYEGLGAVPSGLEIPAEIASSASEEKAASKAALIQNRDAKLAELEAQRKAVVEKLDEAMIAVSDLNADVNRATIEGRAEDSEVEYDVKELMAERTVKENEVKTYEQELEDIDSMIEQINKAYITKEQEIDAQYGFSVVTEDIEVEDYKSFEAPEIKAANLALKIAAETQKSNIVSQANGIFLALRNYALTQIDNTQAAIFALGDIIYMPEGGEKVLAKHKDLIEKLKKIDINAIAGADSVSSLSGISELISEAYGSVITRHICNNIKCDEADEDYFVGESGKRKDFVGPKAAPETTAAPMREFVYFDYIDYENVPRLTDGSVSKESIINYGHKVPEVWKYMLKNPAYVEKDINLELALNKGGEALNLLRGGILPCYSGEKVIDAETEKSEATYYLSAKSAGKDYVQCQGLEIETSNIKLFNLAKDAVINLELSENNKVIVESKAAAEEVISSELGTFFTARDNKLYYRDVTQKGFDRLKEVYESQDTGEGIEEKISDDIYVKAQFKKNQIGDFLVFAEMEKDIRQQVEEMATKIEEARQDLITELTEVGYNPPADFDIFNDEDYEEANVKLDRMKDELVAEAEELMKKVKTSDTEVVKRRVATLNNNIAALKKDSNELVNLSEGTTADSSLDEEIKAEEANQAVADTYQKEADNSMDEQINQYPVPYCAVY